MKSTLFLSALVLGVFAFQSPIMAEDAEGEKPADASVSEKTQSATMKVVEAAKEFTAELNEEDERHFGVLYGNYNLIKIVGIVREDLGEAMEACGEANPDIKDEANTRYKEWTVAIDPVIKDAEANVANMILAQDYAKPRKFDNFFKLVDQARNQHSKDVEKVPVTTLEACEKMISKMDETQPKMIELLEATLVSLPMAIQAEKEEAARKAAEEEAARKAEEEAKAAEEAAEKAVEEEAEEAAVEE